MAEVLVELRVRLAEKKLAMLPETPRIMIQNPIIKD